MILEWELNIFSQSSVSKPISSTNLFRYEILFRNEIPSLEKVRVNSSTFLLASRKYRIQVQFQSIFVLEIRSTKFRSGFSFNFWLLSNYLYPAIVTFRLILHNCFFTRKHLSTTYIPIYQRGKHCENFFMEVLTLHHGLNKIHQNTSTTRSVPCAYYLVFSKFLSWVCS